MSRCADRSHKTKKNIYVVFVMAFVVVLVVVGDGTETQIHRMTDIQTSTYIPLVDQPSQETA